ncbi:hypothetical protein [uncultured Brevundimonas sp.]|uniref:hypothetical protein n=1 Tax=uncultured Brevundimonas sp. TaxID=213418 RepID=UPI0025D310F8|nr:hypothetical protein [uncultured Brevundimonas sp.]
MWDQALRIAGVLGLSGLTIAATVGAVYVLFKHLGSKWLDAKFAERLADYQHRQNQEIERLKGDLARLLDRTTRLHSQEFEVLPKAWEYLGRAVGSVGSCVSALKTYPNVTWLNAPELERVIADQPKMSEHEKEKVRVLQGQPRQDEFSKIIDIHRFQEASDDLREFHNFIVTKGIFLDPVLSVRFKDISAAMWSVLEDYRWKQFEASSEMSWTQIRDGWQKVDSARDDLQNAVVARLWAGTSNEVTV